MPVNQYGGQTNEHTTGAPVSAAFNPDEWRAEGNGVGGFNWRNTKTGQMMGDSQYRQMASTPEAQAAQAQAKQAQAQAQAQASQATQNNFNLPGFAQRDQQYQQWLQQAQAQQAQNQGQQNALVQGLQRQAAGQDGLAQQQLRMNTDQAAAQQQSMAAGARPGQEAMAARIAAQNVGRLNQGYAGQAALAGTQERMAANQALGGVLGNAQGQNYQYQLGLGQLGQQNAAGQQAGGMGYQNDLLHRQLPGIQQDANDQAKPWWQYALGAASTIGGAILSDRRLKKDVGAAGKDADAFMTALRAYKYKYKDEDEHGEGERLGIMAQDLERSAMGRKLVVQTPVGKAVDMKKLSSALAASVARLNERVGRIEGR